MAYYRRHQYQNYQPVSKFVSPDHITGFCSASEAQEMITYLKNYSGTYPLMLEMRDKFNGQKGYQFSGLSMKQWSIVRKSMQIEAPPFQFTPVTFTHPVDIVVNKGAAFQHFKNKLGMKYGIFTLRVHSIKSVEKSRSGNFYKITMDVSANADGAVSACRVCGKALTDHTSITTGVGPTCAKRIPGAVKAYKRNVSKFMEEMKKEFAKVGITEMTTWHTNIVEGAQPIMTEIHAQAQVTKSDAIKTAARCTVVSTDHIEWVPKAKCFWVDLSMDKHQDVKQIYDLLKSDEDVCVDVFNPKTHRSVRFTNARHFTNTNQYILNPSDPSIKGIVNSLIVVY